MEAEPARFERVPFLFELTVSDYKVGNPLSERQLFLSFHFISIISFLMFISYQSPYIDSALIYAVQTSLCRLGCLLKCEESSERQVTDLQKRPHSSWLVFTIKIPTAETRNCTNCSHNIDLCGCLVQYTRNNEKQPCYQHFFLILKFSKTDCCVYHSVLKTPWWCKALLPGVSPGDFIMFAFSLQSCII